MKSHSVEHIVHTPYPDAEVPRCKAHARAVREGLRTRLRDLVVKVCRSLHVAQQRYKRNYENRVREHNTDIEVREWVFIDGHAKTKRKLGSKATRPYKVTARDDHTFTVDIRGYPECVSSDHVFQAPNPNVLQDERLLQRGPPQDAIVPAGHDHTGKQLVWEAFVGHEFKDDGTLFLWTRWLGYQPEEDTLENANRFPLQKVHEYMRRAGRRVEEHPGPAEVSDADA